MTSYTSAVVYGFFIHHEGHEDHEEKQEKKKSRKDNEKLPVGSFQDNLIYYMCLRIWFLKNAHEK